MESGETLYFCDFSEGGGGGGSDHLSPTPGSAHVVYTTFTEKALCVYRYFKIIYPFKYSVGLHLHMHQLIPDQKIYKVPVYAYRSMCTFYVIMYIETHCYNLQ